MAVSALIRYGSDGDTEEGLILGVQVQAGKRCYLQTVGHPPYMDYAVFLSMANEDTSMNQTMTKLQKLSSSEHTSLMRVLFGHSTPSPIPTSPPDDLTFHLPNLDPSQKEAVRFALSAPEVALIHGPPGVSSPSHPLPLSTTQLTLPPRQAKPTPSSN